MSPKRSIIKIDENKCNGCEACIPNCPEGALQIIDGKARLVSDLFCDGLGACIGHCPEGAIQVETREAEPYDERKVMENIVACGPNTIQAHLRHLQEHGAEDFYQQALAYLAEKGITSGQSEAPSPPESAPPVHQGCPGSRMLDLAPAAAAPKKSDTYAASTLRNWPIQLKLVPPQAPYFRQADLLIAADCVAFSLPGFQERYVEGRVLLVGCPKLDDAGFYVEKISEILKRNEIQSVLVLHMEVPCCFGMVQVVKNAVAASGRDVPLDIQEISIRGEIKTEAQQAFAGK